VTKARGNIIIASWENRVTKARGNIIIAGWENRAFDWAVITSEALIREVMATRKNRAPSLVYWLGM
jgi:hypothetical protein